MATIIQRQDFLSGITSITENQFSVDELDFYITEKLENTNIRLILGKTLGDAFIADLTGTPRVPQTAKYLTIFNELDFSISNEPYYSTGLKDILKKMVFVSFTSDQTTFNSGSGNIRIVQEAAQANSLVTKNGLITNRNYESITNLQNYVMENPTDYPDFKGYVPDLYSPL
jgi:hypothetical protein